MTEIRNRDGKTLDTEELLRSTEELINISEELRAQGLNPGPSSTKKMIAIWPDTLKAMEAALIALHAQEQMEVTRDEH